MGADCDFDFGMSAIVYLVANQIDHEKSRLS